MADRRESDRRWRDKNREKERERHRADYAKHRALRLKAGREWRESNREKSRVTATVSRAVKSGVLVRGQCEEASKECLGAIQAHHDDYDKPLDVRWFCRRHHMKLHARALANLKARTPRSRDFSTKNRRSLRFSRRRRPPSSPRSG